MLQGVVAVGIALGAVIAAKFVTLRSAVSVLPIGAAMGVVVMVMVFVHYMPLAMVLMVAIGACAGFFVVPMNALLQHRGHVLMGAGHSIAVQNFNENIGILVMVGLYALMVRSGMSVSTAIILFGVFVAGSMLLVMWRHRANQREFDSLHLIGMDKRRAEEVAATEDCSPPERLRARRACRKARWHPRRRAESAARAARKSRRCRPTTPSA